MSGHRLPQGPGRMWWKRGSLYVGWGEEYLKEEGVWADVVSEGAGARSLQPRGGPEGF